MSKLDILALSTGPNAEPCGTPYESVTLSDKVFLIFTDWCLLVNKKKQI